MDTAMQDEPLPAPTGPNLMSMFLKQSALQAPAAAADVHRNAISPAARIKPDSALAQRQQAAAGGSLQQESGRMSSVEQEACLLMHGILSKYKDADPFRQPVDVHALGIPDYFEVIKQPMDLKTVRDKLRAGSYKSIQEWQADLQMIWDNARKYNGDNHPVTNQALKLQTAVEKRMDEVLQQARINVQAYGEPRQPKPARPGGNKELNALLGSSAAPSSDSDSLEDDAPLAGRASSGRLINGASSGAPLQRSPEPPKAAIKRERDAADASGRAAKRRPPPAGAGAGAGVGVGAASGSNQGLDLDSLAAMLNTPMARQLGAEEPDDLAFLALWKRLMTRKQQLAASATDAEPLRASNQQLRANLASAHATISEVQQRLQDESAARQAAVAAKEDVERQLADANKQQQQLQADHEHLKGMLEQQRNLLEQQQELLRKFARQKQAALEQGGQARAASTVAASATSH